MIISMPVEFDFRATKIAWTHALPRFTGWWQREDGAKDDSNFAAEIITSGQARKVRFAARRLPEKKWGVLRELGCSDNDVEEFLENESPLLLVPQGVTYMGWDEITAHSQPADPWKLREDFLRMQSDVRSVIAFLDEWGSWDSEEFIELSQCNKLQEAIRQTLTGSAESWFSGPYSLLTDLQRSGEFPFLRVRTNKIETALRMTVTADLLNKAEFRTCARIDCGQPFKVESKHDKKFCSRACAHLEAVRRSRKATKKGA
jgi:hypothetical protein